MKDEKFILTSLDDENSKAISEVLGSKTCKKIIDFLAETKEASEQDIASALKIPINTTEYNLKKLIKSRLVEKSKNFFWSVKGRRIEMFKLAKKHIIISPKEKRPDMKAIKTLLPVFAILALFLVVGAYFFINNTHQNVNLGNQTQLKQFSSYDELNNFLKANENHLNNGGRYYSNNLVEETFAGAAPTATKAVSDSTAAGGGTSDYSKTNIQVEGVDEPDIVKNDGKYIYTLSGDKIVIVDAYPAENMKILSEINASGVINIFVNQDRLILFKNEYNYVPYAEPMYKSSVASSVACFRGGCGGYSEEKTLVYVYDIKDRSNPILEENLSVDGSYFDARMIDDYVYLISSKYIYQNNPMPLYSVNGVAKEIPVADVYYFGYYDNNYVFNIITSIKLGSEDVNTKIYLTGSTMNLYVSENNIYLTGIKSMSYEDYEQKLIDEVYLSVLPSSEKDKVNKIMNSEKSYYEKTYEIELLVYNYSISLTGKEKDNFDSDLADKSQKFEEKIAKEREQTVVHKINVNKGDIEYKSNGAVPGYVLNQFSMDEYNGNFRIATTTGNYGTKSMNNLYVLNENMKTIGKVEDLAPGERIKSTRFIGKRAYIVTFKTVDPFFVIDLSNPSDPSVLGYLKIPGYSDYLHPYDENHIIGIGQDVNESIDADKVHSSDAVYYTAVKGVKISLFDVTDVNNPTEVAKYIIGDRGSYTPVSYDHKALLFDKDKNLLVIPVSVSELVNRSYSGGNSYEEPQQVWQGAYVLNIDLNDISLRGKITHIDNQTSKYGAAKDDVIGATREVYGINWTKVANNTWITDYSGYESSRYTDYNMDNQPGGINDRSYLYDNSYQIQRSLYMNDFLYTISLGKIKANNLKTIDEINKLDLNYSSSGYGYYFLE
jgi:inhibitor of cysteine peptidase